MERNLAGTTKRFALSSLKRRWWVIPLAVLATMLAGGGAASLKAETYTSSSWTIATADTGSRGPGRAFDASRLALSYASSLSEDDQLLSHIAQAINRSPDEVDDNFSTLNQTDTAVVRLRYQDEDPEVATLAARAAAEGSVGSRPVATSITPGTMELVQLAKEPERSTDLLALGLAVGAALGLGLGIILMLAWERADPRVDDPADATALTGIPATQLDNLTPSRSTALLERWLALSGRPTARIALVATPRARPVAEQVAGWLYGMYVDGPDLDRGDAHRWGGGRKSNGSSGEIDSNDRGRADTEETPNVSAQAEADQAPGNGQDETRPSERVEFLNRPDRPDYGSAGPDDRGARWRSRWYRPATAPSPAGTGTRTEGETSSLDQPQRDPAVGDSGNGAPPREPDGEPVVARTRLAEEHDAATSTGAADPVADRRITLVAAGSMRSENAPEVEAMRSDLMVLLVQKAATHREVLKLVATLDQFGRKPAWVLMIGSRRKIGKSMDRAQASGVDLSGQKASRTASGN